MSVSVSTDFQKNLIIGLAVGSVVTVVVLTIKDTSKGTLKKLLWYQTTLIQRSSHDKLMGDSITPRHHPARRIFIEES
ncbi:hypothetical protein M434DRAFT_39058 [Hypoxylon sp. CO27-5]|nr:hypothetical protein M434DRAFT_39058 [Hypoxylon sp. CO27-5]